MDGIQLTWIDTLGVANKKWSYYSPATGIVHFAHVEAPETGVHQIVVNNQPGCTVQSCGTAIPWCRVPGRCT